MGRTLIKKKLAFFLFLQPKLNDEMTTLKKTTDELISYLNPEMLISQTF